MDFPNHVLKCLKTDIDDDGKEEEESRLKMSLKACNDQIETIFSSSPNTNKLLSNDNKESSSSCYDVSIDSIRNVASCIKSKLLDVVGDDYEHDTLWNNEDDNNKKNNDSLVVVMEVLLRTIKNLLRWYVQLYLSKNPPILPRPLEDLQTIEMLGLYVWILKKSTTTSSIHNNNNNNNNNNNSDLSKFAALCLFYATYATSTAEMDETIRKGQAYLVDVGNSSSNDYDDTDNKNDDNDHVDICRFAGETILNCPNLSIGTELSLVRLAHNLLVSYPGTLKRIETLEFQWKNSNNNGDEDDTQQQQQKPEWTITVSTSNNNKHHHQLDLIALLIYRVKSLVVVIHNMSNQLLPIGHDETFATTRNRDLISELLRVLYVLRGGSRLTVEHDSDLIVALLCGNLKKDDDDDEAKNIYPIKLLGIALLMDIAPEQQTCMAELLLDQTMDALLNVLEGQVSQVVDHSQVGPSVATALSPILSVLNKFSIVHVHFRRRTKSFLFPPDSEVLFWEKVRMFQQQQEETSSQPTTTTRRRTKKNNMSPLDAPRGTLRWKVIRLMTWTESHVKRLSSELLWTLCEGNPTEFIYRVGFGNGMPTLSTRGYIQMPTTTTTTTTG